MDHTIHIETDGENVYLNGQLLKPHTEGSQTIVNVETPSDASASNPDIITISDRTTGQTYALRDLKIDSQDPWTVEIQTRDGKTAIDLGVEPNSVKFTQINTATQAYPLQDVIHHDFEPQLTPRNDEKPGPRLS